MAVNLNRRLVLEERSQTTDGSGGFATGWETLGTLWGAIEFRTGRESVDAGIRRSASACRILVRAAAMGAPSRPRPDQSLRAGSRVFMIRAVQEYDAAGHYLACLAYEEVAA